MWLNNIFANVFTQSGAVTPIQFMICVACALATGLFVACAYMYKTRFTKSFVVTLATLPAVVCMVIIMVNGNLGAGVAVAGTFSLVRFRSVPGTAKEIGAIFLAMGAGLAAGMGYVGYAVGFAVLLSVVGFLYNLSPVGNTKNTVRSLRITIPEDLDYTGAFEDLFLKYTTQCELVNVKTAEMGSVFKLTYDITLADIREEKQMLDEMRCRNGNLEINVAKQQTQITEL